MRHLHYSADDERSLCGHRLRVPVRTGSRVIWVPGVKGVHFSKARKSDCAECRKLFRQQLRTARELSQAGQKHTFRIVYEQIETRELLVKADSLEQAKQLADESLHRLPDYPGRFVAAREQEIVDVEEQL